MKVTSIRNFAAVAAIGIAYTMTPATTYAQGSSKIKVGLMLPFSGSFAALGTSTVNGFKLYVEEQGGKLAGLDIEYVSLDDESNPAKAVENATRLVKRDGVDVLVGTMNRPGFRVGYSIRVKQPVVQRC